MNHRWGKTVLLSSVATGALIFAITGTRAQGGDSQQASAEIKTAEHAFKNIQVLKGIPAEQLIPSMQFMSNSLGVDCAFCHDETAFEKDGNEAKATARTMIRMQMAINKEHFDGHPQITCYSCHRGAHEPVGVPIIADEDAKHAPQTGTALPTADQILDKFIQASGGAETLKQITSRFSQGTIMFGERKIPLEVFAKAPGQRISIMHTPKGDNITAYDGHSGWLGNPGGGPPRDMTAAEAEAAQFDADFYLPLDLKKMFDQFRVRPVDKIGDHDVVLVIGMKQGHPPLRLFFDQQSGLLVRSVRYAETPLGRNPTQLDYADYREQNGVKLPFRWTLARPLGRFTIQIDQMQQNVPIDDGRFAKPAAQAKADAGK
ncbi:MAG TPA: c-type cytochrome [Candidatus Angelobacter sp.]|nr:c-type cytochrome [Candidatus Angelobacter sp.]